MISLTITVKPICIACDPGISHTTILIKVANSHTNIRIDLDTLSVYEPVVCLFTSASEAIFTLKPVLLEVFLSKSKIY